VTRPRPDWSQVPGPGHAGHSVRARAARSRAPWPPLAEHRLRRERERKGDWEGTVAIAYQCDSAETVHAVTSRATAPATTGDSDPARDTAAVAASDSSSCQAVDHSGHIAIALKF
jgi:hypothetical protein